MFLHSMPGFIGTLREFKRHKLHSGSKHGPLVRKRSQALAIAFSEMRHAKRNKLKYKRY